MILAMGELIGRGGGYVSMRSRDCSSTLVSDCLRIDDTGVSGGDMPLAGLKDGCSREILNPDSSASESVASSDIYCLLKSPPEFSPVLMEGLENDVGDGLDIPDSIDT